MIVIYGSKHVASHKIKYDVFNEKCFIILAPILFCLPDVADSQITNPALFANNTMRVFLWLCYRYMGHRCFQSRRSSSLFFQKLVTEKRIILHS